MSMTREEMLEAADETPEEYQDRLAQDQERADEIAKRTILKEFFEHPGWTIFTADLAGATLTHYDEILKGLNMEGYHTYRGRILEANRIVNLSLLNESRLAELYEQSDDEGGSQ